MTDETINNCLSLAEKTFQQWGKISFEERRALMLQIFLLPGGMTLHTPLQ